MEPAEVAAVAYGAETVVEGAAGAAIAVAQPTMPIRASWQKIETDVTLRRARGSISVVKGRAYIFGGEAEPGVPVDSAVHVYTLPSSGVLTADYQLIPSSASTPPPRIGHTAAVVGEQIYIFGGCGGGDTTPLEEHGRVWVFDTDSNTWSHLDPIENSPFPEARSYHASTSSVHPLPPNAVKEKKIEAGTEFVVQEAERARVAEMEGYGTVFIHAGCAAEGRLNDIWSFDVAARFWSKLPDAPGPARSGTSIALARDRLYRFGGFDDTNELGDQIDYLELAKGTFDDKGGKGELSLTLKSGRWESVTFPTSAGPGERSVGGLHAVTTGQGRNYLVCLLGEKSPSSSGHNSPATFWDDVWSYQLRPDGMTAASFKDATRQLVGAKTAEGTWARVEVAGEGGGKKGVVEKAKLAVGIAEKEKEVENKEGPGRRGWFASAKGEDVDSAGVVIWGGIDQSGRSLGDGWILTVE